jgi:ABC-2 type transport system ATP-binding protein
MGVSKKEVSPCPIDVTLPGVESVRTRGRQMRVVVSGDAELVIERANLLHASSIEVVPVSLRDIFMETVKEI